MRERSIIRAAVDATILGIQGRELKLKLLHLAFLTLRSLAMAFDSIFGPPLESHNL